MDFKKLRKILLEESNWSCSSCGFDKRREDGGCVLEVDHIDGNHKNNDRSNLRVLCPNCHSLTPNFRHWGRKHKSNSSGREHRRKEYKEALQKKKASEEQWNEKFKEIVLNSDIDFSKFGWVEKLSKKTNVLPQKISRLMKKLLPDFYVTKCFRRSDSRNLTFYRL